MKPKPLAAVRVLEFGGYISGPYATSILCALGADVVKVERPGHGDEFRHQADNRSPYFVQYNAGKRSIAIDLKSPAGICCIKALIPRFDVVIENMRPGKMDALGLSEPVCRALRDDLIYLSLTGFGEGGPLAGQASYDTIAQSFGGLYTLLADEGAPQLTGAIFADLITGLSTATGILAALVSRETLRAGHHVQTSLVEAVSAITVDSMTQYYAEDHHNPSRQSRHPFAQNYCARTASGEFIAMHCSSSQKFWRNLATAVGRPELADDERFATYASRRAHYHELVPIIEREVATRPYSEWERVFTELDVPFAPVQTMDEFVHHPQIEWLELLEPERGGLSLLRAPWRFDGSRPDRPAGAPRVGEHTREVVGEVYAAGRIDELLSDGVLGMSDDPNDG
jgi:crotonobetainyl-CoA:carnitine CoA-transferase CaiB-like acyl-CoA transferase